MGTKVLSEEELEEVKVAFKLADEDGKGYVDEEDFPVLLAGLGLQLTEDEYKSLLKASRTKMGEGEEGRILVETFLGAYRKLKEKDFGDHEIRWIFNQICRKDDEDTEGKIVPSDFKLFMEKLGRNITLEEARDMVVEIATTENEWVTFEEFQWIMKNDWFKR